MTWAGTVLVATLLASAPAATLADARDDHIKTLSPSLQDFSARVDAYVALRRRLERQLPPLAKTSDPNKIYERRRNLAELVRQQRPAAQRGDIFTAEAAAQFREIIRGDIKETGTSIDTTGTQEKPDVATLVNANYPEDEPLASVPPVLLSSLPPLPDDMEYRFVRHNLLLLDRRANLIVDYLPRIAPPGS